MTEPRKSLTASLRESIDARKLNDPRIEAMVSDVRLIRTEVRGLSVSGHLALGNSREAVEAVTVLSAALEGLREEHRQLLGTVSELREQLEAMAVRVERQGKWITDNSKKAKP